MAKHAFRCGARVEELGDLAPSCHELPVLENAIRKVELRHAARAAQSDGGRPLEIAVDEAAVPDRPQEQMALLPALVHEEHRDRGDLSRA